MTPAEFRAWRKRFGLTQVEAGAALGVGGRHISQLERGKHPIQRFIDLACRYLAEHPAELAGNRCRGGADQTAAIHEGE